MSAIFIQGHNDVQTSEIAIGASPLALSEFSEHATIRTATHPVMVRSKLNVRRKASDVSELAALIRSQGLLQNLVGFHQLVDGEPTGIVEIVAGARRLDAVGLLIARGHLPADYQIPYLCVTEDEAVDISLAENLGREAMHPADVFEAMQALAQRGRSIDDMAVSFNVDALTVRRRLKLANVAPRMLALYRSDEASFEQMMALAISDDHAAQEQAWDALSQHRRDPHELRRLLTAQQIDAQTDRLARFVGVAAFEKAGGVVTRDLFSNSGGGYMSDAALLERLAMEKLDKERRKLAKEGHGWVEVLPRADYATLSEYGRVRTSAGALSDDQLAQLASLDAQVAQQDASLAELTDDADGADAIRDQLAQLRSQRRAIEQARPVVANPDDKALAGAVITVDEGGNVVIKRDLIRPADKVKMAKLETADETTGAKRRSKGNHSDRLTRVLTSHRTAALQAAMMARPDVAVVVLTHALLSRLLAARIRATPIAKVTLTEPALEDEARAGAAAAALAARREHIVTLLPSGEGGAGLLAWMLSQEQGVILDLLAYCAACSLDTVQEREAACPGFAELASALQLDISSWWKPTASNYFNHLSKERILAVVTEAVSVEAAVPLEAMTKANAAASAERLLAEVVWLPEPLRS